MCSPSHNTLTNFVQTTFIQPVCAQWVASLKHTESYDDFLHFRTLDWQAMMEGAEGNDLRYLMLLRMEVSAPLEMREREGTLNVVLTLLCWSPTLNVH